MLLLTLFLGCWRPSLPPGSVGIYAVASVPVVVDVPSIVDVPDVAGLPAVAGVPIF